MKCPTADWLAEAPEDRTRVVSERSLLACFSFSDGGKREENSRGKLGGNWGRGKAPGSLSIAVLVSSFPLLENLEQARRLFDQASMYQ